jgi:hypothetical protein
MRDARAARSPAVLGDAEHDGDGHVERDERQTRGAERTLRALEATRSRVASHARIAGGARGAGVAGVTLRPLERREPRVLIANEALRDRDVER